MKHRRGYILLLVLVLIAMAGMLLTQLVRTGLGRAMQAQAAERELQHRWGVLSCRTTFIDSPENLLFSAERHGRAPLRSVSAEFALGDETYRVVIADEQAKANVNALLAEQGRTAATTAIQALAGNSYPVQLPSLRAKPRPQRSADEEPDPDVITPLAESYGQVFSTLPPADLLWPSPASPVSGITCWGDGTVNYHRATRQVLVAVCSPLLMADEVDQMLKIRTQNPDLPMNRMLDLLQTSDHRRIELSTRLNDESTVHSVWIGTLDHGKSSYSLSIVDSTDPDHVKIHNFSW